MSVFLPGLIALALLYLLLGSFHWPLLLAIFLLSPLKHAAEQRHPPSSTLSFLFFQFFHLAFLLLLSFLFPSAVSQGWWFHLPLPFNLRYYLASLSVLSGSILCVSWGGLLIARIMHPFSDEIASGDIAGLRRGGRYIGWLERLLIFLLVLMRQPSAIGFLIAAKSILRFGEIKEPTQRKVAEYIIIGTFLSFAWALFSSALAQLTLQHWLGFSPSAPSS